MALFQLFLKNPNEPEVLRDDQLQIVLIECALKNFSSVSFVVWSDLMCSVEYCIAH